LFNGAETDGFRSAFKDIPIVESINMLPTHFRLVRYGSYPPKRGTLCVVNDDVAYLFITGFMPEFGTYPGLHIPMPAQIKSQDVLDLTKAAMDIFGLTRVNWNTASMTVGQPVTLSFARKIKGIMAKFGDKPGLPASFRFYI